MLDDSFAATLETYLREVEPERGATVRSCQPISGGYSRVSAIAEVEWLDGTREKFVVRGDPPSDTGVFESERVPEWQLLQALSRCSSTVRIPEPRYFDAEGDKLGVKCMLSEFFGGTSLQAVAAEADDLSEATQIFVETAAAIHSIPLDALPPDMERPADWDAYLDHVIAAYEGIAVDSVETYPVLTYVSAWLRRHRPPPVPLTLVHGDWRPSNVLVADAQPPHVIDWEFGHVGDPREDLGYYFMIPMPPNLYKEDPGSFLARYRELTGLTEEQVNPEVVEYFLLIGMAMLLGQMISATGGVAAGQHRGVMAPYLISGVSHMLGTFLDVCKRLDGSPRLGGAA